MVTRSEEEALALVQQFRQQIAASGDIPAAFAALAAQESHCGSARAGGDLGFFGEERLVTLHCVACWPAARRAALGFTAAPQPLPLLVRCAGRGQMQKQFEDVAFGLEVGQLSEPFFSGARWQQAAARACCARRLTLRCPPRAPPRL